jgi:hypothetical protein
VIGRQVNLATIPDGASLYSVAREWFRNDPAGAAEPPPSKRMRLDSGSSSAGAGVGVGGSTVGQSETAAVAPGCAGTTEIAATADAAAATAPVEDPAAPAAAGSSSSGANGEGSGEGGAQSASSATSLGDDLGSGGSGACGTDALPALRPAVPVSMPRPPPPGRCPDGMLNSLAGAPPKLLLAGHVAYWREVRRWWCAHYKRRAARYEERLEARGINQLVVDVEQESGGGGGGGGSGGNECSSSSSSSSSSSTTASASADDGAK